MTARPCIVTFTDERGSTHEAHVQAESLYEAVALAVEQFRTRDWVPPIGPGTRLQVEVRSPVVRHAVAVSAVVQWTAGTATSPADRLKRARVKALLG